MKTTIPAHHPMSDIRACDLTEFASLVPPSGRELLRLLGERAALALLNAWPGVQVPVPKRRDANAHGARRWAQIAAIVGDESMTALAAALGGNVMEVPTCNDLRIARRNHVVRQQFDELTAPHGGGLSKAAAVQELVLHHAPITYRQIELILDQPSRVEIRQNPLF